MADEPTEIRDDTQVYVVIDRLIKKTDDTFQVRLTDSLRIALEKGNDRVSIFTLSPREGDSTQE